MSNAVLEVDGLVHDFKVGRQTLRAVDDVSFTVAQGETLGIVGESGCGKSTLARAILRLTPPTAGRIVLMGTDISSLSESAMRPHRRHIQAVFQDPMSSLDPRMTVRDIVGEPLRRLTPGRSAMRARVDDMLALVGLTPDAADRYPHAFSGGQRQRIAIARALAAEPRIVVCDEATSALDVSVQAQILNLIADIRTRMALSLIFISHNLGAVRHVADRVAVMYLGRIVEIGSDADIFERPAHPYTQALLAASPEPSLDQPQAPPLMGEVPSPLQRPGGCDFHPRCARAQATCRTVPPPLSAFDTAHHVRCYHPG